MNWFATFLFLYAGGTLAATATVTRELGRYFFSFMSLTAFAMAVVACLVGRPLVGGASAVHVGAAGFALTVVVAMVVLRLGAYTRVLAAPVAAGAVFAVLAAFAARPGWGGALLSAHLLSSAALLGVCLVAMTLGHWYLANAALSFDHLLKLTRLLLAAVALKALVSGVYGALGAERLWMLLSGHFDGILAGIRVLVGLGGGAALAWMAHQCARLRSNQSATGILYVAVVLILIGELVSIYLTLERGVSL